MRSVELCGLSGKQPNIVCGNRERKEHAPTWRNDLSMVTAVYKSTMLEKTGKKAENPLPNSDSPNYPRCIYVQAQECTHMLQPWSE